MPSSARPSASDRGHGGAIGVVTPVIEVPRAPHVLALCEAAVTLADHCNAFAIVAITRLGNAARVLSALRPRTPIFASTETDVIARQLTIYRGVDAADDRHREGCRHDGHVVEAGAQHAGSRAERLGGGVHQRERAARARRSEFREPAEIRVGARPRSHRSRRSGDCRSADLQVSLSIPGTASATAARAPSPAQSLRSSASSDRRPPTRAASPSPA